MFEEMKLRSFIIYLVIAFIILGGTLSILNLESNMSAEMIATLIIFVLFPLFWFNIQMKKHDMHLKDVISWSGVTKKMPSLLLITLTIMLFSLSFFWIQTYLFSIIAPEFAKKQLSFAVEINKEYESATGLQILGVILSTSLVAPIAEEFIFRGFFLKRIAKKTNIIVSLIITNVLFAILHVDYIGAFMFGLLLSLIYLKTNNLLLPILIHFFNNFSLSLLALFKVPMPDFLNYTDIDQVASFMIPNLIMGLISLPFLVYYLYTYRLKKHPTV
ncbi:MAG TPA: type II CAAX endopeptidase family protein [Cerasibacillus sp.]|uniref:CPBP family intramembrane glutamic endopeptidase n=1 Tax=Cerasibacillus sp. TaxID=2498711 RepID=UPI002F3F8CFF